MATVTLTSDEMAQPLAKQQKLSALSKVVRSAKIGLAKAPPMLISDMVVISVSLSATTLGVPIPLVVLNVIVTGIKTTEDVSNVISDFKNLRRASKEIKRIGSS